MGRRAHHPRRGSLGYSPRKRATRVIPRVRAWVKEDKVRIQGFSGYKAGVTHVVMVDDYPNSLTHEEEITAAATVIEAPPMRVCGVRCYGEDAHGSKVLAEVWSPDAAKDLARVFRIKNFKGNLDEVEKNLDRTKELRLIVHTQPGLSALSKKTPEIMEYPVSGTPAQALEYVKKVFGKEIKIGNVFEEGEIVDTISITKGKGFQGALKRWGTKHLPRKTRKGRRTVGTLGPWHPAAMMWTVPTGGQMGYHQRTENNKRILKIGGGDITPEGGFLNYGVVKGDYIILKGSVAGPRKRLVRLRPAVRPPKKKFEGKPQLTYISRKSKQGL
ncbi:MAG: 50S ribosomal protein L3 [Euryarchaeota archaeon]|nr:50S ribosomal protein L3 [Euryarchaeota archaeon]